MTEKFGLSSLSLSLILLALVAVALVLGYNAWVTRRRGGARRDPPIAHGAARAAQERSAGPADTGFRGEPSLGSRGPMPPSGPAGHEPIVATPGSVDATSATGSGAAAQEPRLDGLAPDDSMVPTAASTSPAPQGDAPGQAPGPEAALSGGRLHALTDCIIEFQLAEPVPSDRLLATAQGFRRVGSKPVILEGSAVAVDEPGQHNWALLAPRQRLARVRVGVLLANRHGPLNAMEYSEFVTGVQALAEQLAVLGDTPDMNAVLHRARALDESCAALDAQIGLNVEAPDALGLSDLARLAQETHCVERGNNRHARLAEHGEVVFSLSLSDSPTRLSLLLDVPRAPLAARPWPEMVACARHCAQRLGGRLVDDQGRALTDASLERIEQQLAERQQALSVAGLVPGSTLALRVFN